MRVISGIILGALAGIATGVFMAPDKGIKTRKRFSKDSAKVSKDFEKSLHKNVDAIIQSLNKVGKKKKKKSIFSF